MIKRQKKLKNPITITILFLIIPFFFNAQFYNKNFFKSHRHEISFGIGGSSCLTDLGGGSSEAKAFLLDMDIQSTSFVSNFSYLYYLRNNISLRASLAYAKVSGDDALSGDLFRKNRALNFNTTVVELSSIVEYTLIKEKSGNKFGLKNSSGIFGALKNPIQFGVYLFAGIGTFYYDPWGTNNFLNSNGDIVGDGKKYRLRELHTEGQGFDGGPEEFSEKKGSTYKKFAICIPFGFGIKKSFSNTFGINLEASYRFTNTDYLDDVSTNYYDRDKLKTEMTNLYNADVGNNAYIMSGTQTGNGTNPGDQRGNPKSDDSYMFLTISVYKKLTKSQNYFKSRGASTTRKLRSSF
jgi:hypothetical protein